MKSIEDQKLKDIVLTAKDLFWRFGFKRVSIEEVCREAGVSKMTFYKHFSNKIELVKFIYSYVSKEAMDKYMSIMHQNIPFKEKVKKSIDLKMEQTRSISHEFYNDLLNSDQPEIISLIQQSKKENIELILKDYIDAQKKGEIRKDIKPEFILYFLNHMFDMANDKHLMALYKSPNELIMELINFFFYGILPCNNE